MAVSQASHLWSGLKAWFSARLKANSQVPARNDRARLTADDLSTG